MYCYKHPKVETGLSCGKCERPICTNCMIVGPAGVRCRECASLRGSHLYQIPPARLALCAVVALAIGIGGSWVMMIGSFFVLFIGFFYGGFMAQAVIWASGRKQGSILTGIAVGGIVAGALIVYAPMILAVGPIGLGLFMWKIIGVAIAISACVGRMRYL